MLGRVGRTLTLVGHLGLIVLLTAWVTLVAEYQAPRGLVLLLLVGPLLLPLRGLLAGRRYTHVWASYLAVLYFILAVLDITGGSPAWLAIPQLLLVLAWFAGCVMVLRHREQHAVSANEGEH